MRLVSLFAGLALLLVLSLASAFFFRADAGALERAAAPAPIPVEAPAQLPEAPAEVVDISAAPREMPVGVLPEDKLAGIGAVTEAAGEALQALVIHLNGELVYQHGAAAQPMPMGLAMRPLLSVLTGIAADRGLTDPARTLGDLGIDEPNQPLSEVQKTASIRDLMMGRSAVYLAQPGDTASARGSARPGDAFNPQNWEVRALAEALRKENGADLATVFATGLARPLGMQDYAPAHIMVTDAEGSALPATEFHLSPRDLARIGSMMALGGLWQGQRVLSEDWVVASITPWFQPGADWAEPPLTGYGYGWWVNPETYGFLAGNGAGLFLYADPARAMSLVLAMQGGFGRAELTVLLDILSRR